ncbi:hypothetical protein B0T17DRAFT_620472 [Bombardia bombarda]|uniref:Uncharacterized protein n=1 Tax=Bombardia bombarda TaxID=252184 RepID=A0AA39T2P1_9PEZI|nr:hypothetical protein B0T17DRAFT_620472 [Bombardia bombarda]
MLGESIHSTGRLKLETPFSPAVELNANRHTQLLPEDKSPDTQRLVPMMESYTNTSKPADDAQPSGDHGDERAIGVPDPVAGAAGAAQLTNVKSDGGVHQSQPSLFDVLSQTPPSKMRLLNVWLDDQHNWPNGSAFVHESLTNPARRTRLINAAIVLRQVDNKFFP